MQKTTYIGLGSNLADPLNQVRSALTELDALPQTQLVAHSPWYRSKAVGPGEQPDYINGVAQLATSLAPEALLDNLQTIERDHQRVRAVRWGPRTLDLDILLFGDQVIHLPRLQVPHPRLQQRNFVLLPLADVAPDLTLPDGSAVQALLQQVGLTGIQQLNDSQLT